MSATTLTPDETAILHTLAERGPMSLRELLCTVATIPTDVAAGRFEASFQAWTDGVLRLRGADTRLVGLGLAEGPVAARRITQAGRDALAHATTTGGDL